MSQPDRNEELFVRLLTRHNEEIRRYLVTLLANEKLADEVMQDTALVIWEKFAQYDENRPFLPWACRFAYFEVLRYRKQKQRDRLVFSDELLKIIADERNRMWDEIEDRRKALNECLEELPHQERQLIARRYESNGTVMNLAKQLRLPPKKLYYSLEKIRQNLWLCINGKLSSGQS